MNLDLIAKVIEVLIDVGLLSQMLFAMKAFQKGDTLRSKFSVLLRWTCY